jgi:hypothetical protein
MLKKLLVNIKIFFHYLFIGMRSADNEMTTGGKDGGSDGSADRQPRHRFVIDMVAAGFPVGHSCHCGDVG